MIRFAPVVLTSVLATAAPSQAAQAPAGGVPQAQAAQFAQEVWTCTPKKYAAYGTSRTDRRTTGGPLVGGPLAFYTAHLSVEAIRCKGKTRIAYKLYMNTMGFPSNRYVGYQLQSAGRHKKFRATCPRLYGGDGRLTNRRSCFLKQEDNIDFPKFGARATYQFRGDGVIRYIRMPTQAYNTGPGENLAGRPMNFPITLSRYVKLDRSRW